MDVGELKKGVYFVGALDEKRRLFDEVIPLPDGTSYNSYLVVGSEKTALIDAVDPRKEQELVKNLRELNVEGIDYVVSNHAEQDHSGGIPRVLELYPGSKAVTNQKCKEFLKELLLIPEDRFITVNDRETLPLGGKTLEFILAPWVHWPETMLTYLREDRILFTCDLFGSHLASKELYAVDEKKVYDSAKRYYAEIMMPFRALIKGHLEKVRGLGAHVIAPSHGPVYDKPDFILNAYREWVSDDVKNEAVIPYVSMHGSTKRMVEHFARALGERGVKASPFNLTETDVGELAMAVVDAATIVVGTPTFLTGAHPSALYAAHLVNALRPKTRFVSVIGSYGWGGRTVEQLSATLGSVKAEVLEPVIVKGCPKEADFKALDGLAGRIAEKHRSIGLIK